MDGGSVIFKFKGDSSQLEKTATSVGDIIKGSLAAKGIAKALGVINENMDDAIKRVDQLNQFPKVMQALGISSEDSSEAMELINDKILGLPTTLNQATTAVQRFVAKNGDVKTSAKYFTAINDALLSGTNDTTLYSNALEQVMQAYSKGKPDMMEWRSMLTAMPAQLKQVSQAFGYVNTDDLYEALKNGEVSMDDFLAMVVKLDNEGSNGMASFSDSVKDSVGGIGTNMTNLRTAITRGLANTIETLNKTLSSQGLPTISEAIAIATSKINSAFKGLQGIISKIDFSKLITAFKAIIPLFISFKIGTTAFKTFMTIAAGFGKVSKAFRIISTFIKPFIAMSGAVRGTATAFSIFSKALLTTPAGIGLVVGAIAALVTGFIYLWNTSESFRNFWIGLWNGIVNIVSTACTAIGGFFTQTIPTLFNNLVSFIASIPSKILSFLQQIPYFIGYGIGTITGMIATFIVQTIPNFFNSLWNFITTQIPNLISTIINFIISLPGRIWNILTQVVTKVWQWGSQLGRAGISAASSLVGNIVNGIRTFPSQVVQIGKWMVEGLWNGINSAKDWIKNKIKGFCDGIAGGFKKFFKIGSPSKLFFKFGGYIDQGFINGIESLKDEAQTSVTGLVDPNSLIDMSPSLFGSASTNLSPIINVTNDINVETDPLGQVVQNVKTFSGGAKNDYNYGMGV